MYTLFNLLLLIGAVLMVLEIFVPGFVLLPIGLGIFTAAFWTYVTDSTTLIIGLAAVHAGIVFWISHKFYSKKSTPVYKTNTDKMIGQKVIVTEPIHPQLGGYIKLYGDFWKAMSLDNASIEAGEEVIIESLDGNKVIVRRP